MWTSVDYELDWPPELLRGELLALLGHPYRGWTGDEVELLLHEAFHTEIPAADFARLHSLAEWGNDPVPSRPWIADLLEHLPEMRDYRPPRPYYRDRHRPPRPNRQQRPAVYEQIGTLLLSQLRIWGYLDRDFPPLCVDDARDFDFDSEGDGEVLEREFELWDVVRERAPSLKLWPLLPGSWNNDILFDVVEVYHDLVARPRRRWYHQHNDCGWHSEDFDTDAGRRVYRSLVNRILNEHTIGLHLAEDGEDTGRLVHDVDVARTELVERALASPAPEVADRVAHAVGQFRRRDATEHDKRSAIVTLALVLEERRKLLKTWLFRADERALFHIANEFDNRHRDEKQHADYDPAFRDWVFWWYLSTIELTNRLLARQDADVHTGTSCWRTAPRLADRVVVSATTLGQR